MSITRIEARALAHHLYARAHEMSSEDLEPHDRETAERVMLPTLSLYIEFPKEKA